MKPELRRQFADKYLGYGNPQNEIWFVGSEEGAGWSKKEFEDELNMNLTEREWECLIDYELKKNYFDKYNNPIIKSGFYYAPNQNYIGCAKVMKQLNDIKKTVIDLETFEYKHLFNEYRDPNIINSFHINLCNIGKKFNDNVNTHVLEKFGIDNYDNYRKTRFKYIIEKAISYKINVIILYANKNHQAIIVESDYFRSNFTFIYEDPYQRFKFYTYNNLKVFLTRYFWPPDMPDAALKDLSDYISDNIDNLR